MARISRKCYESCFFHIMVQGINKEFIFKENEYKEKFLNLLEQGAIKNEIVIIAYCIMGNHAHMLVYAENTKNLSKYMSSVNTSYAKYYNRNMNRCGFVYRDRYRCENIMTQMHLECCIRYIHNNPVKANICEKPSEYFYSSYNLFANNVVSEKVLKLISWNVEDCKNKLDKKDEKIKFIEDNNEFGETECEHIEKVFDEYKNFNLLDSEEIYNAILNIKRRCNAKNDDIMKLLNVKKTNFYKILKNHKK